MARHGGPPFGSAARDATAPPYIGKRRARMVNGIRKWQCAECRGWWPMDRATCPVCPLLTTYDEPPDDPPRCLSCGHLEADECGCTCCTWTCDERPADV